ncbi:MAG: dethiobiotin synthase [Synechococcales bacterium]|nr:dethiobiotin synthase [Synechococcales bacterium]
MNSLLIAGTDTDAGKTILTSALAAYWQIHYPHRSLGLLKPLQTGVGDREWYSRLFSLNSEEINPIRFTAPLAPPLAADLEGKTIDLEVAWQAYEQLCQQRDFVLVEGLGGLGSPVTHETTVADLAWDWHIPTVLVVPVRLGAIGQAVANVALARTSRVHLRGIILNCVQPCSAEDCDRWANETLMQTLTGIPILGTLPYFSDATDLETLAKAASNLDLERLLPIASWSYRLVS